jgi:hypothetical protein
MNRNYPKLKRLAVQKKARRKRNRARTEVHVARGRER